MINSSINILIVDDKQENLVVLESILEVLDVNIVKATSGNEALGMFFDYDFAIVLLDIQMPEMDGYEVAEIIRSNEKTKNIPIIFITAINKGREHMFRGYNVGAVDYLYKPIQDVNVITSKVKVFIELYEHKQMLKLKIEELEKTKLELEKSNKLLEEMSYFDKLTGIPNRNSLCRHFDICYKNCARKGMSMSLMMVDIDYFKAYNDTYGHIEGDKCLIKVAKAIEETAKRPLDFTARFGGEEFIVILPETNNIDGYRIGENIKNKIESLQIMHAESKISDHLTVSIGLVTLNPLKFDCLDDIIEKADNALYRAKKDGRNKIYIYEEGTK